MPTSVLTVCLALSGMFCLAAQSPLEALTNERDFNRRAEMGLTLADSQFDDARAAFAKHDFTTGNAHLDTMTKALDDVVSSLSQARKSRLYKRAEMRVSRLQRRLRDLTEDLDFDERGWAEQTGRHLNEIHDKLLGGVMGK